MKHSLLRRLALLLLFSAMIPGYAETAGSTESLEFLKKVIEEKTDIPGVIQNLPPSLLENYTLMQLSESVQDASPLNPRAILYGNTGKLIITFNGDPTQNGYESLEIAEFNEKDRRIQFREFIYAPLKQISSKLEKMKFAEDHFLQADDIEGKIGNFIFTKPNPNKCLQCHALNNNNYPFQTPHQKRAAKYIWFKYRNWSHINGYALAYGHLDDDIPFGFFTHEDDRYPILDDRKIPENRPLRLEDLSFHHAVHFKDEIENFKYNEAENYIHFRINAKNHPRYKNLYYREDIFVGFPYHSYDQLGLENRGILNLSRDRKLYENLPNLKFAQLLTANFSRQMSDLIASEPEFKENVSSIIQDLCKDSPSFDTYDNLNRSLIKNLGNFTSFNFGNGDNRVLLFNWAGSSYNPIISRRRGSYLADVVTQYSIMNFILSQPGYTDLFSFIPARTWYAHSVETRDYLSRINFHLDTGKRFKLNCDLIAP